MTVKTREHHDFLRRDDVEDTVGESAEQRASDFPVNLREGERIPLDGFDALIERLQELVTKVVTSLPVPSEGVTDVGFGGVSEPEIHFFRFSSSWIWDQGRAAPGSLWWAANRRSSSARWASVTGSDSGLSAMLSQIASTS